MGRFIVAVSGRAGIVPDFDQCPSNHAEMLYQGRGKTQGVVGLPG